MVNDYDIDNLFDCQQFGEQYAYNSVVEQTLLRWTSPRAIAFRFCGPVFTMETPIFIP